MSGQEDKVCEKSQKEGGEVQTPAPEDDCYLSPDSTSRDGYLDLMRSAKDLVNMELSSADELGEREKLDRSLSAAVEFARQVVEIEERMALGAGSAPEKDGSRK